MERRRIGGKRIDRESDNEYSDEKAKWVRNRANELRVNVPKSEQWFISILIKHKLDHLFINNKSLLGKYIGDFVHKSIKLVIEIDGKVHDSKKVVTKDYVRQLELEQQGYKIIRVKAYDELGAKMVIDRIKTILKNGFSKPKKVQKHAGHEVSDVFNNNIAIKSSQDLYQDKTDVVYTSSYHKTRCHLCERTEKLKHVLANNHALYLCFAHYGHYNTICTNVNKVAKYLNIP